MTRCLQAIFLIAVVFSGLLVFSVVTVALVTAETHGPLSIGITILSPTNTTYNKRNIPLTFYVNAPSKYLLSSVNGAFNLSISGNTTLGNLPDGVYSVKVNAMDEDYNWGTSQTVFFSVNSEDPYVFPQVVIQSPTNEVYNTSQLTLNFTVDQQVPWTAYSLDGEENKTAVSNLALISLTPGSHTLTVYAGHIRDGPAGSATVTFTVSAPWPTPKPFQTTPQQEITNQFIRDTLGFFTSPTFFIIAVVGLVAAALGAIIVLLKIRRPASKKQTRMIR